MPGPTRARAAAPSRRLTKIYGRNDNMVKLRGVNVFPEAIGVTVAEDTRGPTANSSASSSASAKRAATR